MLGIDDVISTNFTEKTGLLFTVIVSILSIKLQMKNNINKTKLKTKTDAISPYCL